MSEAYNVGYTSKAGKEKQYLQGASLVAQWEGDTELIPGPRMIPWSQAMCPAAQARPVLCNSRNTQ